MNSVQEFQELVWQYYHNHGRELPWRLPEADGTFNAYHIWVSELMLQQTQASRVIPKYEQFLATFPDVQTLAAAPLSEVLKQWSGLGYNRRAKFLWQAAQRIVADYSGELPSTTSELVKLPGIGSNTAAAIAAYAYNQPVVFVETNIRTVFIHHFFPDTDQVADKDILPLITKALDYEHPREWYWALMDYGSYLKKSVGNASKASKHFIKQSTFEGSLRQVRGAVIRRLTAGSASLNELHDLLPDDRLQRVLDDLVGEELIHHKNHTYSL